MGTKNNPGKFDCYSRLDPDEPHFVLMGRDPVAGVLVRLWVELRRALGPEDEDKLAEADECAGAMLQEAVKRGKQLQVDRAVDVMARQYNGAPDTERMFGEVFEKLNEAVAAHNKTQDRGAAAMEKIAEAFGRIAGVIEKDRS